MADEQLIRYAAPELYQRMMETFSAFHIHPYEVQATLLKKENGYDVTIRFSSDFSQVVTAHFSYEQASHPDEEVNRFFENAANQCRSVLMAEYYKMIKL
jgi:hypothetical protein